MSANTQKVDLKRIIIYCAFAFGLSWPMALVLHFNGGLFESPEVVPGLSLFVLVMIAYMATPALAHILTRLVTGEGFNGLFLQPKFKQGWRYMVLAWFAPAILVVIGAAVFYLLFPQNFDAQLVNFSQSIVESGVDLESIGMPVFLMLAINSISAVFIAPALNMIPILGEEFGWRAYLQPKLMPLGSRKALVITGIIWGLWHAPVIAMGYNYGNFEMNNYLGAPWSGILMMTLGTVWLGIFFGWMTIKAGSLWPAAIGHGALNGVAALPLYVAKGTPLMLLGPTALGLIGGIGFIVVSAVLMLKPGTMELPETETV